MINMRKQKGLFIPCLWEVFLMYVSTVSESFINRMNFFINGDIGRV